MAAGKTRLRANPEKSQRTVWESRQGNAPATPAPSGALPPLSRRQVFKTAKPHG